MFYFVQALEDEQEKTKMKINTKNNPFSKKKRNTSRKRNQETRSKQGTPAIRSIILTF